MPKGNFSLKIAELKISRVTGSIPLNDKTALFEIVTAFHSHRYRIAAVEQLCTKICDFASMTGAAKSECEVRSFARCEENMI